MNSQYAPLRNHLSWIFILALLLVTARGAAQDGAAGPAPPAAPAAAEQAASEPAAGDEGTAAEQPQEEALPPETDPFVLSVLEVKPTTPVHWLQDIRTLIQLNRPALAKQYLEQFAASLPAASELVELHTRFGSAFFLELSTQEALQPAGKEVADAVLQATDARRRDVERLAGLVDRLAGADAAARRLAMSDLVQAGPVAIPVLVEALADPTRAATHAAVQRTLAAIGPSAVPPLTAALASPDPAVQVAVASVLGELKSREAVPYLLAPAWKQEGDPAVRDAAQQALQALIGSVPSRGEAVSYLTQRIEAFLAGATPGAVDARGLVALWTWDAAQQRLVTRDWSEADAAFVKAGELAALRYLVDPAVEESRIVYLVTALELAKREAGYDRALNAADAPIVANAAQGGADLLERVLDRALKIQSYGAAIAAIDLLGDLQDSTLVESADGQPRLLVRALLDPHRRIQFAAAQAILKCDPRRSYPGSSFLPEVLGHLSASGGRLRVLIGDPRAELARTLAGYFTELGYESDAEFAGRAVALRAFTSPDYAFVLLSDAIDQPPFAELVQVLRRDPRTADLPIGIMARDIHTAAARRLATRDPLTVVLAPPQTREDLIADTQQLIAAAGRQWVPEEQRLRAATWALDAVARLAADSDTYGFYDLMRLDGRMQQALLYPPFAVSASRVLGLLGSPGAQQALVEFASNDLQPLSARQAAAEALRVAVTRRGLRLSRTQLQQQYDLYNASEGLDRGTQEVLASILDTVEAPTRQADPSQTDD
ncbi:MAG: HEAT repeat domain-containing protein [Planctomycetaceae bacterium]|nr:HEAT repeat domain-containing protein [Planctomycetaceae bacterium]